MINYNRKLSNERESQAPSHRMSTLVLLETLIFIKIVSISGMLFCVQYHIPQLVMTANSIKQPLAFETLYTLMDFSF